MGEPACFPGFINGDVFKARANSEGYRRRDPEVQIRRRTACLQVSSRLSRASDPAPDSSARPSPLAVFWPRGCVAGDGVDAQILILGFIWQQLLQREREPRGQQPLSSPPPSGAVTSFGDRTLVAPSRGLGNEPCMVFLVPCGRLEYLIPASRGFSSRQRPRRLIGPAGFAQWAERRQPGMEPAALRRWSAAPGAEPPQWAALA